ncbi:MAG: two-component regulator propeller domain-containing protein [Bacteroidia bacterium]
MKQLLIIIGLTFLTTSLIRGQNLFPEKFDDCNMDRFCLDCGETKGIYNGDLNEYFSKAISAKKIKRLNEIILVQVLIDTTGKQCVKSIQNNVPKLGLKAIINSMTGWQPAISKEKPENVSVTLKFEINNKKILVTYQRFDPSSVKNMKSVGTVEITNNKTKKNNSGTIEFEVYTTQNSIIPWDMTRSISVDTNNIVWLGTDNGIVRIENDKMAVINSKNSPLRSKRNQTTIMYSDIDIYNNKWFTDGYNTYKYDEKNWVVYDSTNSPLKWTTGIYADKFGNVWFQSFTGLIKFDGKKWNVIDISNSKIPSNRTMGTFVDSKKRIWIGTSDGNIMIDGDSSTNFQSTENPLKTAILQKGFEDKLGNIWFSLYEKFPQTKGFAKYSSTGEWTIINTENSKIPRNEILDFAIDEGSNNIWLSINRVGISKYDGKNWETFTPENSKVPSTYIQSISLDKNGNLWCATFAGLLKAYRK